MEDRIRSALADFLGAGEATSARLTNLGGHASLRIYWRVRFDEGVGPRDEHTLMAMVLPEDFELDSSDEVTNGAAPSELPFVNVQRFLQALHVPVPQIDHVDMDLGVVLLEDLGDEMLEDAYLRIIDDFGQDFAHRREPTEQLYHGAINLLVDLQRKCLRLHLESDPLDAPRTIATERSFDHKLLRWELDHYTEWGLEKHYEEALPPERMQELEECFERLLAEILELPQTLSLRDMQSRNLMIKHERLVAIDFQDALMGPFVYDLVALLRDSYVELPFLLVNRLVRHYITQGRAAGLPWCDEDAPVHRAFHLVTVQRKLKDAGRFVFLDKVKGNPGFMPYYEPSIGYVRHALEVLEEYEDLRDLIAEFEPAWHG
ncbi:MAG: phosphotransferase [Myxococcota bacterium]